MRFFTQPTVLGLTWGGILGAGASNFVGKFTLSTIETATSALTNGTCGVPVNVSLDTACLFSQTMAAVISNSTTVRITLCVSGLVLGGLIGLSVQLSEKQKTSISYDALAETPTTSSAEVGKTNTQALLLESDPEEEKLYLLSKPGLVK